MSRQAPPRTARVMAGLLAMAGPMAPTARGAEAPAAIPVTISDRGCEPDALTAPPGKAVFKIRNASRRVVEWEILQGVNVIEERENILPGFVQTVTATLDPGPYQVTCGLVSNPKGALTVANRAAAAPDTPTSAADLAGPLAEYKLYVAHEVDALGEATRLFTDAVKAGQLEEAKALYAPAREHYERIEPIAELFNDLDGRMDSREDDFERKAEDPAFTGFHRIEKTLFADGTTAGLAPLADRLMADVEDLRGRVAGLVITPKVMVGGAAALIEEVASKKISGEEDRYSRTDLGDFQANIDGARKILDLVDPLVVRREPELEKRVKGNFAKLEAVLGRYRAATGGFVGYDRLSDEDRTRLKGPVTALAEDLSALRGTLGID